MEKVKISLNVPQEVLDRLDELAEAAEMDRSRLIVNMLDEFSKTMMACKKVGIFQFSILLRDAGDWMKEWAKKVREKNGLGALEKK
jgi:predicted transcriptional regulator